VRTRATSRRIVLIGPTSAPWASIAAEVEADLARLARPGIELVYRCTGAGPAAIRSAADAAAAAPHVVSAVAGAARDGFDAAIVDCAHDPGLDAARRAVAMPVVGAGEAMRAALAAAPRPAVVLDGDELRASTSAELLDRVRGARTVALAATGWSHLVAVLGVDGRTVVDPLPAALDECLALLADGRFSRT
jgi:Asp/Glu/hydantoin racemase